MASSSFFQSRHPRLPVCGRDRTITGHRRSCSRTIPIRRIHSNRIDARTDFRLWRRERCRSYTRSFVPVLSIVPHKRSIEFQLLSIPEFFKHSLHKAYHSSLFSQTPLGKSWKGLRVQTSAHFQVPGLGPKPLLRIRQKLPQSVYARKSPGHACPPTTVRFHSSCIICPATHN